MCGIVGFVSASTGNTAARRAALTELLWYDARRGRDGTGLAVISPGVSTLVHKKALDAQEFVATEEFKTLLEKVEGSVLCIGHNRFATTGVVVDENAHPFHVGKITLVHNGVVHNHDALGSVSERDVDSAHIACAFNSQGAVPTIEKLQGSYTLVWHDAEARTFSIARNMQRPIHWVHTTDGAMWFASEWEMMAAIFPRHGIEVVGKYLRATPDYVYTWSDTDFSTYTRTAFIPAQPPARPYYPPPFYQGYTTPFNTEEYYDYVAKRNQRPHYWMEKSKSNKPIKRKRVLRNAAKLKRAGFVYNQEVEIRPKQWKPISNDGKIGHITGQLLGEPIDAPIKVRMFSMPIKVWMDAIGETTIKGKLIALGQESNEKILIAVPTPEIDKAEELPYDHKVSIVYVRGPGGVNISAGKFLELTGDGCGNCACDLSLKDADSITWIGRAPDSPVCKDCKYEVMVGGL